MAKVLIIEDNLVMLKAVELRLAKDGFEVIAAGDGKEAMEKINKEMPDIILTDLLLPFMSGLEILVAVKNINPNIPVLVLSAMGQEEMVTEASGMGADGYITKPFNLVELTETIKKHLGMS